MSQPQLTRYADGITAVDVEYIRPGIAAAHIIEHGGRAAFVDTGTTHSVPYLLAALEELGIERAAVDFVFLTHVHLDHAGGAGALMQALPNARAVLHPRGAPHLIDPAKLIAASIDVYGEAVYRRLYGEIVPLPKERVLDHGGSRAHESCGHGRSSSCTRPAMRCITRPSSILSIPAFSPATPSACRIAKWTRRKGAFIVPADAADAV